MHSSIFRDFFTMAGLPTKDKFDQRSNKAIHPTAGRSCSRPDYADGLESQYLPMPRGFGNSLVPIS